MQTRAVTLKFYRRLARLLPLRGLDDKLYGLLLALLLLPVLALLGYAALSGTPLASGVLGAFALATLAALGLGLWAAHHLLAPIRMAVKALHTFSHEQRVLPLPTDLDDDMGDLLRDVRRTLELVEEGRARLEQLSSIDALTGLPNRRSAEHYLSLASMATERSGGRLTVALVAVDRFDALNDQLGSEAGERALRQVADFLRQWLKRKTDWIARWGGDTFIAIMFSDQNSAGEYLENLQRELKRQLSGFDGIGITLSLGVAEQRRHEEIATCLARADDALRVAGSETPDRLAAASSPKVRSIGTALASSA